MVLHNDGDRVWGDQVRRPEDNLGNTNGMDRLNIAIHEVGHAAGIGHSPKRAWTKRCTPPRPRGNPEADPPFGRQSGYIQALYN